MVKRPMLWVMAAFVSAGLSPAMCASEELTISEAILHALRNNPSIAAGQLNAEAAKHAARGAQALANPEIIVAPSVVGDAGSDSAVLFSQPLEINGARKVRGRIAAFEAGAAASDASTVSRDIVRDVKQTYWEVARAQEAVRLGQENVQAVEALRAAVQKQLDVGQAPGSQLLKADVELARARQELAQAQLGLAQAKAALNALLGRPGTEDFSVAGLSAAQGAALDGQRLQALALSRRPEVASAQAELGAARGRVQAARLQRVPDLAVQARRETFEPDSDSGIALAVNLPIIDWGSVKAESRRAEAAARSQERRLQAVTNQVALDVEQAIQQARTASQVVQEYQGGILEKSERLTQMARTGYEKGATSLLEVLEAQRTLRSTRTGYYSALADQARAIAQLEWAIGCELTDVVIPEVKK